MALPDLDLDLVIRVLADHELDPRGIHGVAHWARVLANGRRLAAVTGADTSVVSLFALLHDSCRLSDGYDPDHGRRAAEYTLSLAAELDLGLDDDALTLLADACAGHADGMTDGHLTVQTCWDADRLDLLRVGIRPDPSKLCTDAARDPAMLRWANTRAGKHAQDAVAHRWLALT